MSTPVYLARQLSVRDVELREHVARGQGHLREVSGVPRAHDDAPRLRVRLDRVDDLHTMSQLNGDEQDYRHQRDTSTFECTP